MTFGAPGWLLLALLNVLIVLLHARRRRTLEVPSVVIWRLLEGADRPQRSWRPPPLGVLLLLQLLVVTLAALALARPAFGGGSQAEHRIFVLDASGSMSADDVAPSRFAGALRRLRQELAVPGRNGVPARVSLVTASPRPAVVAARRDRLEPVRKAAERLRRSDGAADWRHAAELVAGLIVDGEATEITVLTDGAGEDGPALLRRALPGQPVVVETFGGEVANLGFARVAVSLLDPGAGRWRVEGAVVGRVASGAADATTVRVLFEPAGSGSALEWARQEVALGEGFQGAGMATAAFDFEIALPGAGTLELLLPEDAAPSDDRAIFVLRAGPRIARVLYLGPGNPPLFQALEALGSVDTFRADELPAEVADYDLVIVDRVTVPRAPPTNRWWLGGARPEAEPAPEELASAAPTGWRAEHPWSASVAWEELEVRRALRLPRAAGAAVLVEASGAPLVQVRATAAGRELITPFRLADSNWTELPAFPTFVANLLRGLVPDLGEAVVTPCVVGLPCALEPRLLAEGATLTTPAGEVRLAAPFLPDPESGVPWAPAGFGDDFIPLRAGLYRLEAEGPSRYFGVNAFAPAESDVDAASAPQDGGSAAGAGPTWAVWRWLLLAILAVVALEAWLAGRGPERFLRRSGLAPGRPYARRRRALLALRLLTLTALALAAANVMVPLVARRQNVVLVTEPGPFGPDARSVRSAFVERVARSAGGARHLGVVVLGAGSQVEADLGPAPRRAGAREQNLEGGARLEDALALAAGMLPDDQPGRIVLAASGLESRGEAARLAPLLRARGVPVDVFPVPALPPGEVVVAGLTVPARLFAGDTFVLTATVFSERASPATLRVLRGGELVAEQQVTLQPGMNRVETEAAEEEAGRFLYQVEADSDADVLATNNRDGVLVDVAARPRLALVTPQPERGAALAAALEVQGLDAQLLAPQAVPWTAAGWEPFDAAVLLNVPAIDLHTTQQEVLERWVRGGAGGLLLLGGENTFGPGGYYRTPLERLSPLSSRVPREAPKAALAFVLDRSGSMQRKVGEVTRLDLAKEATVSALELLDPESVASVVVYDSEATALVPLRSVADIGPFREALRPLQPGGGTSLYPGLALAYEQLGEADAMVRHIVIMSDGLSQPADFPTLLREIRGAGITVSAVAVGEGADVIRMQTIARLGGGAFHATRDVAALPSILSQEALLLSSTPVKEERILPVWQAPTAPVADLTGTLPPLHGYVLTTLKEEARLLLGGEDQAGEPVPLLASWRIGAGQVVAFASQGTGPWARDWQAREDFPLLWSQLVRAVLPAATGSGPHVALTRRGDTLEVGWTAPTERSTEGSAGGSAGQGAGSAGQGAGSAGEEAGSAGGRPGPSPEAFVTPPEGAGEIRLPLLERRPGEYTASVASDVPGTYLVRVEADGTSVEAGTHIGYPARYDVTRSGSDRLRALARATEGRVLRGDEAIFVNGSWRLTAGSGWPAWALLGLLLFLAELLLRYAPSSTVARRRARTAAVPAANAWPHR